MFCFVIALISFLLSGSMLMLQGCLKEKIHCAPTWQGGWNHHCIISARKHQAKARLSTCSAGIITVSEVPKHLLVEALSQLNCHCPLCNFPTIRAKTGRVTLTQNEQSLGITSGTLSGFCLLCESTILVVQPFEEIWILIPTLTFKHLFQNKHAF